MKKNSKVIVTLFVIMALLGAVLFFFHTYNKKYYSQFGQYNGKAKIDDYEMIADGAGLIANWK